MSRQNRSAWSPSLPIWAAGIEFAPFTYPTPLFTHPTPLFTHPTPLFTHPTRPLSAPQHVAAVPF